jgi:hypothetical protein
VVNEIGMPRKDGGCLQFMMLKPKPAPKVIESRTPAPAQRDRRLPRRGFNWTLVQSAGMFRQLECHEHLALGHGPCGLDRSWPVSSKPEKRIPVPRHTGLTAQVDHRRHGSARNAETGVPKLGPSQFLSQREYRLARHRPAASPPFRAPNEQKSPPLRKGTMGARSGSFAIAP